VECEPAGDIGVGSSVVVDDLKLSTLSSAPAKRPSNVPGVLGGRSLGRPVAAPRCHARLSDSSLRAAVRAQRGRSL
jgi:hypothetical protein